MCFAEEVPRLEGLDVDFRELRITLFAAEIFVQPLNGRVERSVVQPIDDSESEHVPAAVGIA